MVSKATDKTSLPSSFKIQDITITDPDNMNSVNTLQIYEGTFRQYIKCKSPTNRLPGKQSNRITVSSPTCASEIPDINSLNHKKVRGMIKYLQHS